MRRLIALRLEQLVEQPATAAAGALIRLVLLKQPLPLGPPGERLLHRASWAREAGTGRGEGEMGVCKRYSKCLSCCCCYLGWDPAIWVHVHPVRKPCP